MITVTGIVKVTTSAEDSRFIQFDVEITIYKRITIFVDACFIAILRLYYTAFTISINF